MMAASPVLEIPALTPRQREVIELAAKGLTNGEIGGVLGISPGTVKIHLAAIYRALDVTNRTEAATLLAELDRAALAEAKRTPAEGDERTHAVAVLPFENLSGDPSQEVFADGLVSELIARLSQWRWFPVIARQSSFQWRGGDSDLVEVGRNLGATYVVDGTVRTGGDRVRVTAQLIDSRTKQNLWSEGFDRPLADVFQIQDEISQAIASAIHPELVQSEVQHARTTDPADLGAWGLAMRGLDHLDCRDRSEQALAIECFEEALERDGDCLPAVYGRALAHYYDLFFQWSNDPEASLAGLREGAERCARIDPNDAYSGIVRGTAFMVEGRTAYAIRALRDAVERNPNSARAHSFLGQLIGMNGDPDQGITMLREAIRLSPRDPLRYSMEMSIGISQFAAGRLDEAYESLHHALELREVEPLPWAILAATCGLLGLSDEATIALEELERLQPGFRITGFKLVATSVHPDYMQRFEQGMRAAGFVEPE